MNATPLSEARDEDARNVEAALIRAAQKARQYAAQTRTPLIMVRDEKIMSESVTLKESA